MTYKPKRITRGELEGWLTHYVKYTPSYLLTREALMLMDELDAAHKQRIKESDILRRERDEARRIIDETNQWQTMKAELVTLRRDNATLRSMRDEARQERDEWGNELDSARPTITRLRRELCEAEEKYRGQRDIIDALRRGGADTEENG